MTQGLKKAPNWRRTWILWDWNKAKGNAIIGLRSMLEITLPLLIRQSLLWAQWTGQSCTYLSKGGHQVQSQRYKLPFQPRGFRMIWVPAVPPMAWTPCTPILDILLQQETFLLDKGFCRSWALYCTAAQQAESQICGARKCVMWEICHKPRVSWSFAVLFDLQPWLNMTQVSHDRVFFSCLLFAMLINNIYPAQHHKAKHSEFFVFHMWKLLKSYVIHLHVLCILVQGPNCLIEGVSSSQSTLNCQSEKFKADEDGLQSFQSSHYSSQSPCDNPSGDFSPQNSETIFLFRDTDLSSDLSDLRPGSAPQLHPPASCEKELNSKRAQREELKSSVDSEREMSKERYIGEEGNGSERPQSSSSISSNLLPCKDPYKTCQEAIIALNKANKSGRKDLDWQAQNQVCHMISPSFVSALLGLSSNSPGNLTKIQTWRGNHRCTRSH